jgi:XTP/dITP diphosphohydrolase
VDRLLLVTYSPRIPAGVLSAPAWAALRAGPVYAADDGTSQALAVRATGIEVRRLGVPGEAGSSGDAVLPGGAAPPADRGGPGGAGSSGPAGPAAAGGEPGGAGSSGRAGPSAGASEPGAAGLARVAGLAAGVAGGPGLGVPADLALARAFRELARGGRTVVWLAGPDGDPGFARALGDLAAREPADRAEVEVVYGSWDPPGARLLDVVAVMDRLRSPGGCPWDAEQTHASLAPYLLEEAYEMLDAIADDDLALLREELGDVLLQVAFHSRLAEELPEDERWTIDDVAGDLVAKLVRRHPHVFGGREVTGAAEVEANWEHIKAVEKSRSSLTEGVPLGQPALALAAKLQARVEKAGLPVAPPAGADIGHRLFALVAEARAAGVDPEAALRAVARAYRDAIVAAEASGRVPPDGTAAR